MNTFATSAAAVPHIVLGVSGGIAAYKACYLLRQFKENGYDVTVVPTAAALEFVGAPTWAALSGRPVSPDVWHNVDQVPHVRLGQEADLVMVAPATADLLAKAATGLADDLLTNTLLTAQVPIIFAPAMHTEMWQHPATVANVATLRQRGALVIEPATGRLTGADTGPGRLPEPEELYEIAHDVLQRQSVGTRSSQVATATPSHSSAAVGAAGTWLDLAGRHVVVSAGGTREYLDPVRFLSNRSSGRQGYALARAAVSRGARVTLVAANVQLPDVAGTELIRVETTAEMQAAVVTASHDADALVMAAAPADFRPAHAHTHKIKKDAASGQAPAIDLIENPDILAGISQDRPNSRLVVVGFAAETGDESGSVLDHARSKLARKGCDLLVVNDVGEGRVFGELDNEATILSAAGSEQAVGRASKSHLSHVIWDHVAQLWS